MEIPITVERMISLGQCATLNMCRITIDEGLRPLPLETSLDLAIMSLQQRFANTDFKLTVSKASMIREADGVPLAKVTATRNIGSTQAVIITYVLFVDTKTFDKHDLGRKKDDKKSTSISS